VTHGVREQYFGGEAWNSDSGVFEELLALSQRGVDGQAASLCSLSFSV
jgi:hypothetical protein